MLFFDKSRNGNSDAWDGPSGSSRQAMMKGLRPGGGLYPASAWFLEAPTWVDEIMTSGRRWSTCADQA